MPNPLAIFTTGGVFWTKFEHFLSKTPNDCALRAQNRNARAGKKEGGWGEGIFARPRFPPPNFVFCFAKCAAINGVVFAPPTRAHTTIFLPLIICIIIIQHCLIMQQEI